MTAAAWEASKSLLPFLWQKKDAPYVTEWLTPPLHVVPATSKTGIGTPRSGSVAHRVAGLAAVFINGRAYYGARWNCGRRSPDVVLLAGETSHGGPVCFGCDPEEPTVYRCFAASGELLYVGSTIRRRQRMKAHAGRSRWWPDVADVTYQDFPDIDKALIAERVAIRGERPSRNTAGRLR